MRMRTCLCVHDYSCNIYTSYSYGMHTLARKSRERSGKKANEFLPLAIDLIRVFNLCTG